MNKKSKKRETSGGRAPEAECKRIFQSLETVLVVTPDWDREEGVVLASTERRPGLLQSGQLGRKAGMRLVCVRAAKPARLE